MNMRILMGSGPKKFISSEEFFKVFVYWPKKKKSFLTTFESDRHFRYDQTISIPINTFLWFSSRIVSQGKLRLDKPRLLLIETVLFNLDNFLVSLCRFDVENFFWRAFFKSGKKQFGALNHCMNVNIFSVQ